MEIKTVQEWIEYAEDMETNCENGEDVYSLELISIRSLNQYIANYYTLYKNNDIGFDEKNPSKPTDSSVGRIRINQ